MPSSDKANMQKLTPIQQLNLHNKNLEASLSDWRSNLTDRNLAETCAQRTLTAMGAAVGILESETNKLSPRAQLALRTIRLAKRTFEELKNQKFGDMQIPPQESAGDQFTTPAAALELFDKNERFKGTNTATNAAYQDMYFKHYFALLFSDSFSRYGQLDIVRLANTITNAALQGAVTIKMPFQNKDDADKFVEFAKSGGIPFCSVAGGSQEAGFIEGGRQIAVLSLRYDGSKAAVKGAAPAAPSTIREYTLTKITHPSVFEPLQGGVYGTAPTLQQMQQLHSSSEQTKKSAYTYFKELQYAEKFNEANLESKAAAKDVFIDLINDYMQYMGYSIDAYDPPELQTFFNSDKGKEFLAEFKKFYESGTLAGSASVEKKSQLAQNEELGLKRAKLFQTAANEELEKAYGVAAEYLLGDPSSVGGRAVSAWENENEAIKSWAGRLDKLENSNKTNYREYSQLARALLFGDYVKAKELNGELKVFGRAFFDEISSQKAALVQNEDGTYSISNSAFLEKLISRNDTKLGLRFEGTLTGASKPRDRFGAFFVDALLEPDRQIEFTTGKLDTRLAVEISPPTRDGSKVTAQVTVFVDIERKDRDFIRNHANILDVSGVLANGTKLEPVFAKEDGEHTKVNGRKATVFTVTFNTGEEIYITANAHKGDLESGWAWQTVEVEKTEKVEYLPIVKAYNTNVTRGATQNMKLSGTLEKTHADGKKEEGTVDVRVAFGLRLSSSDQVKLFFSPSPDARVRKELVYPIEVRGEKKEIAIDRGLVVGDKTYSKDELLSLARSGVVGIKSSGRGGWITLDGQEAIRPSDVESQSLEGAPDGMLYTTKPKYSEKRVLSTAKPEVPNIAFNNPEEVTLEDGSKIIDVPTNRRSSQIPLAIPLPESGTVKFGNESYTAKELKRLAEQNIIAIIADKKEAGRVIRTVYRIDGAEICPLKDFMTGRLPRVDDLFVTRQNVNGNFTVKTYIPNVSGFRIGGQAVKQGKTLKAGQYNTSNTGEVVLLIYPEQAGGAIEVPKAKEE